jgi:hypothetical protein
MTIYYDPTCFIHGTYRTLVVNTCKQKLLPVCFNVLPGVGTDSLLQNRVISIFPPFGYIIAD